jgi:hypothetical protein
MPTACRKALFCTLIGSVAFIAVACHSIPPVDTKPLDSAGMTYDSIRQLQGQKISTPEIAEVASAKSSGLSDATCVTLFKISRDRQRPFDAGDAIAGLYKAGVSENTIIELAKLDELGISAGELEAMRLAGLSDGTLLEVARHRAANQPVLSGASLAELKNVGLRESTLFELARRGVPDSKAGEIASFRRHGGTDAAILTHFSGS